MLWHCFRQTVTFVLLLILAIGFLLLLHVGYSATLSISTHQITKDAYAKDQQEPPVSSWDQVPYDSTTGLLWFVHLTDLHISKFRSPERTLDLQRFCRFLRAGLAPPVVVVTGDLTDGKTPNNVGSTQYEDEWISYKNLWKNYCVENNQTLWLDIRGNHDTFDVKSDQDKTNYFNQYGVEGNKRSYLKTLRFEGKKYAFVGIDATLTPGPKRPFNFFGSLTQEHMDQVESLLEEGQQFNDAGFVVFGHYPLSTVVSPSPGIKTLVGNAQPNAYLSGHLHNLLELANEMYTKQPEGYLDLELADWKDHRLFRVAALDRGHLSFTDQRFSSKTKAVILITNPLEAKFIYGPRIRSAFDSMMKSTHLRVLVFSDRPITSVTAKIDDGRETLTLSHVQGPLYVAPWNPNKYKDQKLHHIIATAKFRNDVSVKTSKTFTLSIDALDQIEDFGVIQRFILMANLSLILQAGLAISISLIVLPMCLMRVVHRLALNGYVARLRNPQSLIKKPFYHLIRGLWIVSNLNCIFYPVVVYLAWVAFGPWGIGYFLEDDIGVVFSWGLFVLNTWLPTYTTMIYSYWFMIPYWFIMMAGVTWTVARRCQDLLENNPSNTANFCSFLCQNWWFVVVMLCQGVHCVEFYMAYGLLASFSICGFFRLVFFYCLWSRAVGIKYEDIVESGIVTVWLAGYVKKSYTQ